MRCRCSWNSSTAPRTRTCCGPLRAPCPSCPSANAAAPLEALLAREDLRREVRREAIIALGNLADPSDFPLLVRLAFRLNYFVRCRALDELLSIA